MTETEFLLWVRGPAFQGATVIFVLGVAFRLLEILLLGRKPNLAEARGSAMRGGLRTIATRSFPDAGTHKRSAFTHYRRLFLPHRFLCHPAAVRAPYPGNRGSLWRQLAGIADDDR